MYARCPFYGFRWPERKSELQEAETGECALDFDGQGLCQMERDGLTPDYDRCPAVIKAEMFLAFAAPKLRVRMRDLPEPLAFAHWHRRVMGG